ncbi:MAG: hypothetical protein AB7I48_28880 [Planctomycetaceae bacterium]
MDERLPEDSMSPGTICPLVVLIQMAVRSSYRVPVPAQQPGIVFLWSIRATSQG